MNLLLLFLGNAFIIAIVTWLLNETTRKNQLRVEYLKNRMQELYGPLYILVHMNKTLFDLTNEIHKACSKEYEDTKIDYSIDCANLINKYVNLARENNKKIIDIIGDNSAFIDPKDIDNFMNFYRHYTRNTIESWSEGKCITPLPLQKRLERISYFPKDFEEKTIQAYLNKKEEIDIILSNFVRKILYKLGIIIVRIIHWDRGRRP